MELNTNKTVLLVFSLSAGIEAERKPVFGQHKNKVSKKFYDLLISETLAIANKSGVDVVWMDETQQQGSNFAERYTNAYKKLFSQGYTNVLSIGNDTPNLSIHHLKEAIKALDKHNMVVGPSTDGGIYLLGLTKAAFNENEFQNLPWLTAQLSGSLGNWASTKAASCIVLETLSDIDSKAAVIEYAYSNAESVIGNFIRKHLHKSLLPFRTASLSFVDNTYQTSFLLRGPPRL